MTDDIDAYDWCLMHLEALPEDVRAFVKKLQAKIDAKVRELESITKPAVADNTMTLKN